MDEIVIGTNATMTVAEAARRDGGIILPDDPDESARDRTLSEFEG